MPTTGSLAAANNARLHRAQQAIQAKQQADVASKTKKIKRRHKQQAKVKANKIAKAATAGDASRASGNDDEDDEPEPVQLPLPTVVPDAMDLDHATLEQLLDEEKDVAGKAVKIRLFPTTTQKLILNRWIGTCRWIYNQCVSRVSLFVAIFKQEILADVCNKRCAEAFNATWSTCVARCRPMRHTRASRRPGCCRRHKTSATRR